MSVEQEQDSGNAAARYVALATERDPFLRRARDASRITIPSLIPPEGADGSTELYKPFQSFCARGVNHLANKLLLVLLPPNMPFFRLTLDQRVQRKLEGTSPDAIEEIEKGFAGYERDILKEIGIRGLRVSLIEAVRHLIVGGNVLLYLSPTTNMRAFPLSQYTVSRDPEGNPLEIVVKEVVSPEILPDEVQAVLRASTETQSTNQITQKVKTVDLYTHVRRVRNMWRVHQEVKGIVLPGSHGQYPIDKCPWMPLRWTRIDGESYGRGMCEDYYGDMATLESIAQSLTDAAAGLSKFVWLVKPGITDPARLAKARNNDVLIGDREEVGVPVAEKTADFTFVYNTAKEIKQDLSWVFLMNSAVPRDAERVTAEEIRLLADEIETGLGGVYAILSEEFQLPLVKVISSQMERQQKLAPLPKGTVHPMIVTGYDALGRSQELTRLSNAIMVSKELLGDQAVAYLKPAATLLTIFRSAGVPESDKYVKTDAEVAQAQQQAQLMTLAEKSAGPAVKAIGDRINQQPQANQQQAPPAPEQQQQP